MDKISIIIPVYNSSRFLQQCLQSIISQTYCNWEVVLVDDASTDGSYATMQYFAAKDPRFRVYQNPANLGAGESRKKALNYATGDYVVFIDSDDYVSPAFLEQLYNCCVADKTRVAACGVVNVEEGGRFISQDCHISYFLLSGERNILEAFFTRPWFCQYHANKMFQRSLISDYRPFRMSENGYNTLNWLLGVDAVSILPEPLYYYRRHTLSTCSSGNKDLTYDKMLVCQYYYDILLKRGYLDLANTMKEYMRPLIASVLFSFSKDDKQYIYAKSLQQSLYKNTNN